MQRRTEIYNTNKEALVNHWMQLQVLKEQGVNVTSLEEDAHRRMEILVELEDNRKLLALRKELKHTFTHQDLEDALNERPS